MTGCRSVLFVIVASLVCAVSTSHAAAQASVLPDEMLTLSNSGALLGNDGNITRLSISPALAKQLHSAQEYFFVGKYAVESGSTWYLLLVMQQPSTAKRGVGRCGAGTEDSVQVLELDRVSRRLIQRDQLLLQSCLLTISLADDSGATLRDRLEPIGNQGCLRLKWLGHPTYGEAAVTLSVQSGRLRSGCTPRN